MNLLLTPPENDLQFPFQISPLLLFEEGYQSLYDFHSKQNTDVHISEKVQQSQQNHQPQINWFVEQQQMEVNSRQFQIYVGNLPSNTTGAHLQGAFSRFGEILNIFIQQGKTFGFVNFKNRESAMKAYNQRVIYLGSKIIQLSGYHKKLTIILSNVPEFTTEQIFQEVITDFFENKIFTFIQFVHPNNRFFVYLHFLSEEESAKAIQILQSNSLKYFLQQKFPDQEFPSISAKRFIPKDVREMALSSIGIYITELPVTVTDVLMKKNLEFYGTVSSYSLLNNRTQSACCIAYFEDNDISEELICKGYMDFDGEQVKVTKHYKKGEN